MPLQWAVLVFLVTGIKAYYDNSTEDFSARQLLDFKLRNPASIGLWTTGAGEPVDVRDTIAINNDFFTKELYLDANTHFNKERVPERVVHPKGVAAFGYFEVTNDVSKYTKADVFNGIGKKTPLVARLSTSRQRLGGTDLSRDFKGLGVKMYTKDGNLDFTCLNLPVFILKDSIEFGHSVHTFRWNTKSNLEDFTMQWDFNLLNPARILPVLWMMADYGLPRGFRKLDMFPMHVYELTNKYGDSHYVKFNFRTEQGLDNFTTAQAQAVSAENMDYFTTDLYNAIAAKNYPSWRLDIDVLSARDVKNMDYNPFDITKMWRNGTFHTVTIGRMVLNQFGGNHFRDSELSIFNPGSLVPGIPGPSDFVFKSRRLLYRDTHNYRVGLNHNNIEVNAPKHRLTYTRDGRPPVRNNMDDAPNYYPNSFNGPLPYVDEERPSRKLLVLQDSAIDFQEISNFYNYILENDAHRQRTADNVAQSLVNIAPSTAEQTIDILTLADKDLGKRVLRTLTELKVAAQNQTPRERYREIAECLERNMQQLRRLH